MRRLTVVVYVVSLLALLILTWSIDIFHVGVFPVPPLESERPHSSQWLGKEKFGINQLVLSGGAFERGLDAGKATARLLFSQEKELTDQLRSFLPSIFARDAFFLVIIRWFWGAEKYFEPWATREMYGVSKSASHDFDDLGDPFTRQIAYHGLHEVGQLMVDQGSEDMGCTVVAVPHAQSWIIGRNFDFEGGRVFDSEKIMKWVFPDQGYAFISVIWAGMVGAVTGVNEFGVYISLNAAGSRDFRRHGTPSTLVLLKALQFSKTADEALQIIKDGTMFITDIFVVADRHSRTVYRVEKSPLHTEVLPYTVPLIVTNHLLSPRWSMDSINVFRRDELTSGVRAARGEQLLAALQRKKLTDSRKVELEVLEILRDKGEHEGKPLHLGNRRAIDAQIATHAVVYNAAEHLLYVSQGPGVSGAFVGFDLAASFKAKTPVAIGRLPRDPRVSDATFSEVRGAAKVVSQVARMIRKGQCAEGEKFLQALAPGVGTQNYSYYSVLGDYRKCIGDVLGAKAAWKRALGMAPAYPRESRALEGKLAQ